MPTKKKAVKKKGVAKKNFPKYIKIPAAKYVKPRALKDAVAQANAQLMESVKVQTNAYNALARHEREWARQENAKIRQQLTALPKYQVYPYYVKRKGYHLTVMWKLKGHSYTFGTRDNATTRQKQLLDQTTAPKNTCGKFQQELQKLMKKYNVNGDSTQ